MSRHHSQMRHQNHHMKELVSVEGCVIDSLGLHQRKSFLANAACVASVPALSVYHLVLGLERFHMIDNKTI